MIIEITGMPGVGKTTLLQKTRNKISHPIILYSDDIVLQHFKISGISSQFIRRIVSQSILILLFFYNYKKYNTIINYVVRTLNYQPERLIKKISIIRNVILKVARFDFIYKNLKEKVIIVDEGISHIPFNLIDYSGSKDYDIKKIFEKLGYIAKHIKVVVLFDNELDKIMKRLKSRGHKRLKNNNQYSLDQFVFYNERLVNRYKTIPTDIFSDKLEFNMEHVGVVDKFSDFINKTVQK